MAWCSTALISYLYIIIFVHSSNSICIWGRTEDSTTYVNGLYSWIPAQDSSGLGYYEKTDSHCPANNLYLYLSVSTWHIGPSLGNTTNYVAICDSSSYIENPYECGSNWKFDGQLDSAIQVFEDACPVLDECELLNVVYWSNSHCRLSPDDCCGPFDRYISDNNNNIYFKPTLDGGRYLYFSNADFRWVCSKSVDDTTISGKCQNLSISTTVDAYSLQAEWRTLTAQVIRDFTWSSNKNKTAYIECATFAPTPTPTTSPTINYTMFANDLAQFKAEIKEAFDNSGSSKPLLASSVRLVFNDCIGPKEYINADEIAMNSELQSYEYNTVCDGCINYINDDFHDGLIKLAVEPLDFIYSESTNDWSDKMSTADFWAAVGTYAIEYGIENAGGTDEYPYYFGRRDCTESPMININETTPKTFNFESYDSIIAFFESELNFTKAETLTIMGAHTLGVAHSLYSGFNGQWTSAVDEFDNSWYSTLLDDEWEEESGGKHWIRSDATGFNMLNADILVGYDIGDYFNVVSGEYECIVNKVSSSDLDTCPIRTATTSTLEGYQNSNELFLTNFKKVWIKMVTIGYDDALIGVNMSDTPTPETTAADIAYMQKSMGNAMIVVLLQFIVCVIHL